jgi:hypothetical protein
MCLPYSVTPSNYAFCDGWQRLIRRSTPANGDGQRPKPGHIRLLQGIEPDNHRSEGDKHLSTPRYSSCQRHVSGTQTAWLVT